MVAGVLALPNETPTKTIGVALLVALTCSLLVSITAVALKPPPEPTGRRTANPIPEVVQTLAGAPLEARLVDLASGNYVDRDPGTGTELPAERDAAGLGGREDVAAVFEYGTAARLTLVILPVRGTGYQSTLKGYLALQADLTTVAALTFYEQEETPGMGARIDEADWQALWRASRWPTPAASFGWKWSRARARACTRSTASRARPAPAPV